MEQKLISIGSLWKYKKGDPHALLASGKHSNGFLNLSILNTHPKILREFTQALGHKLREQMVDCRNDVLDPATTWVIGSAMGGISIALFVAEQLGFRAAYTEKKEGSMSFERFATEAQKIEAVLPVEDVMTTGSTTIKTILALHANQLGQKILPFIGVLINRSGKEYLETDDFGSYKIISVMEANFDVWTPEDCPLCKEGVELLKPKLNWDKFTGV